MIDTQKYRASGGEAYMVTDVGRGPGEHLPIVLPVVKWVARLNAPHSKFGHGYHSP